MPRYAILTNSKRALIALVHSVVFFLIAAYSVTGSPRTACLLSPGTPGLAAAIAITSIYVIVSSILLYLTAIAASSRERLYFALCSTSAVVGFLRAIVGDPGLHGGNILRPTMLAAAIVVCTIIWRTHPARAAAGAGRMVTEPATSD